MNNSRLEWKVGLFVCIGLALLAVLLLQFSKGTTFFRPTYEIQLHARGVGGLKPRAQVVMSGVQVGTVADMRLDPDLRSVTITLRIYRQFDLYKDARFVIEQAGFLGDQYVAVLPTKNQGARFVSGDEAWAEAPLDLQEVARSAAGFLQHIDSAATNINETLSEARRTFLNAQTLTNLSVTMDNLHHLSERSLILADNVNALVESNRPSLNASLSNFLFFSEQINQSASALHELLATNSPDIQAAVQNIKSSTDTVKALLAGVQEGKGLAGNLLENEQLASNVSQTVYNLTITSSNLNRLGLWGVLWKHKPARSNALPSVTKPLTSPKNSFN